jgi:hypothetical protein
MIDFKKCEVCTEKRCDLAFLQKTEEEREEEKFQKKLRETKIQKIKDYTKREKKYWLNFAKREQSMVNYDRKPYMNESDWMHDKNWFIAIQKVMELDELQSIEISNLYNF